MYLDISSKQKLILNVIKNQIKTKGYPPSVREMSVDVGLSPSTVHSHLVKLENKGYIKRDSTKPRAIEVLDKSKSEHTNPRKPNIINLPVIGQITSGQSILSKENIEQYIPFSENLLKGRDNFILKVKGDSMINVGILHGDNVIVHKNNKASNDEIVVALLHKEYITVKKYFQENDIITLKPENNSMDPIVLNSKDVEIIGIVTGVFRVVE